MLTYFLTDGPGDSVKLSSNLTTLEVDAGEPVPPVTCSADCHPACHYAWYRYYRTNIRIRTTSTAVLKLGNASSTDVGIYMCEAEAYVIGKNLGANVTFELRVKCKPKLKFNLEDVLMNIYM